jgi:tetrahydromethanopterin S-methyltransferase subunit G
MHLADRLGDRALRVLGIATGALFGLALLVVVVLASGG